MLIQGDARHIPLRDESVQCIVTSPPYYRQRDYGYAEQIGLEDDPQEFVAELVEVFRGCRRVLRKDGTLWVVIGDTAASGGRGGGGSFVKDRRAWAEKKTQPGWYSAPQGYSNKDILGIPWRLAFALQDDGWCLRQDIVWFKPNGMPESAKDRPSRVHEYLFLFSKSRFYYYDYKAIQELAKYGDKQSHKPGSPAHTGLRKGKGSTLQGSYRGRHDGMEGAYPKRKRGHSRRHQGFEEKWDRISRADQCSGYRNKRSVWVVPPAQSADPHFAQYPPRLITPCILAGCPVGGIVFDPFVGSGTTVQVARKHNRIGIGLDMAYQDLAKKRISNVQRMFVEAG